MGEYNLWGYKYLNFEILICVLLLIVVFGEEGIGGNMLVLVEFIDFYLMLCEFSGFFLLDYFEG